MSQLWWMRMLHTNSIKTIFKGVSIIEKETLRDRLSHSFNILRGKYTVFDRQEDNFFTNEYGSASAIRQDKMYFKRTTKGSIVSSIYNQLANDAAGNKIQHVRLDEKGNYEEPIESALAECFGVSANIDQTGTMLVRDLVMTMFEDGYAVAVPIEVSTKTSDIYSIRVGRILQWYPKHVKVSLYNVDTGRKQDIILPKEEVAIIENPLYSTMNEPNSTMQRLTRKINLADRADENSVSGKLDLLIQLPYTIKSSAKQEMADKRKASIEDQMENSKYGIAYIDATERVTQLNRPVDNNLSAEVDKLTEQLYNQLGLTAAIFNGTADEATMLNYYNRSIAPILDAITEEVFRKFLTKTARTQKQTISWRHDPFKLVPISNLAEIADKFTRNEIASANEIRSIIGWCPASDPKADELRNSNIAAAKQEGSVDSKESERGTDDVSNDE